MSVTEQDRERAIELMATIKADALWITSTRRELVDLIAAALADERERAYRDGYTQGYLAADNGNDPDLDDVDLQ